MAGYGRIGTLRLLASQKDVEAARVKLEEQNRPCHVLDRDDIAKAGLLDVPARVSGALFFSLDARVDPRQLGQLLAARLQGAGIEVHEERPIVELLHVEKRVVGARAATGKAARADSIVIAAGVQSAERLANYGLNLPMVAVRGQAVAV